jgi:MFS family permease
MRCYCCWLSASSGAGIAVVHEASMSPTQSMTLRRAPRWLTLGIVGLGVATGPLDSAVNIAFPAITQAFAISLPTIQWVIICYVLTYASLLLSCGRLGDVVGHRRVFLVGLGWSAVSLVLCGAAPTFGWFLAARGCKASGQRWCSVRSSTCDVGIS